MDLTKLKEPFPLDCIEWKPGMMTKDKTKAMAMAYVDARAVQDRLDEVCGPGNWQVMYTQITGGFLCDLMISCIHPAEGATEASRRWVSKQDGAQETDFEALKGGISSSLRRAGSAWGIGRYLYKLEPQWLSCETYNGKFKRFTQTPKLPLWALPGGDAARGNTATGKQSANTAKPPKVDLSDNCKKLCASIAKAETEVHLMAIALEIENTDLTQAELVTLRGKYNNKRKEVTAQ